MEFSTISRTLITIAILMQLFKLRTSKNVSSNAFFIYSFASYMMVYDYYQKDRQFTERVLFKMFNSTMLLLVAIFSM
jgi:hypothetical protein